MGGFISRGFRGRRRGSPGEAADLWKSARWVAGLRLLDHDQAGFWESLGYHQRGDPWQEQRYWGD